MSVITLTTDFGTRDWFVGTMRGVIAGIAPRTKVIDPTHGLPPGDIRGGAFALAASWQFFPKGTVHVAVVDPGVGSQRRAIAVETARGVFVGPDNGVLSWALRDERITAIHALENEAYFLRPVSRTFHGRDIFAPVAAHLSRGVPVRKFGPVQKDLVRLDWPVPRKRPGGIEGEVINIDRFGIRDHQPRERPAARRGSGGVRGSRAAPVGLPAEGLLSGGEVQGPGRGGGLERVFGDRREWRFGGEGVRSEDRDARGAPRVAGGRALRQVLISREAEEVRAREDARPPGVTPSG